MIEARGVPSVIESLVSNMLLSCFNVCDLRWCCH
jgi:hypothetical protein